MPRVLVLRTSAMGDVVHALPLAGAIRRHWPDANIGWVVERRFAPLVANHHAVDEVLEIDLKAWRKRPWALASWRELGRFLNRLHGFDAEIVIDAMGNHKAGILAALSGAERRLGAARNERREPSSALWINDQVALEGEHVIDRTLSLLKGLDIAPLDPADPADPDFGLEGFGVPTPTTTPPILIHPGAGWRNKEYPPERWGAVASTLRSRTGLEVAVLSGPGEESLATAVTAATDSAAGRARILPAPTLEELASVLRGARLVLAGDTGPLHLAQALGTPVLCVLGPTDPERNGAYKAAGSNVFHRLPCSYCYQRLDEPKACLLTISSDEIVDRALPLIAEATP